MPLGASRLSLLAFQASVTAEATVIRKKVGLSAKEQVQVDTAQYKYGSSALFDGGTDDYILVDHTAQNIDYADDFTLEMWVRWASLPGINTFSMLCTTSTRGDYLSLYNKFNAYTIAMAVSDGSTAYTQIRNLDITPATDTWYHIAAVKNGSSLKFYWDGAELTNDNGSAGSMSADKGMDGIRRIGDWASGSSYAMNGHIDEFRLSKSVRYTVDNFTPKGPFVNDDDTQLLVHMDGKDTLTHFDDDNGAKAVEYRTDEDATNLQLAVPFDDANGVNDVSHLVTGTSQSSAGTVTQGTSSVVSGGGYYSSYNSSLHNNNTGDSGLTYVPATAFGNASSASYTVELWVKATDSTTNGNWLLSSADSGSRWLFGFNNGSTVTFGNENMIGLGDSDWHHVAIVNDSGSKRFYIDGVQKTTAQGSPINGTWYSVNTGFSTLHVGQFSSNNSNEFNGNYQDLRVYNHAKYSGTDTTNANFALPKSILKHSGKHVALTPTGTAKISEVQSKINESSMRFVGDGGIIVEPTHPEDFIFPKAFTFECFFYVQQDTGSASNTIISNKQDSGGTGTNDFFVLYRNHDNKLQVYVAGDMNVAAASGTLAQSTWHHMALVRDDSGNLSFFVNGTRQQNVTGSNTAVGSLSRYKMGIGSMADGASNMLNNGSGTLTAYIDNVRVSDTYRYNPSSTTIVVPTAAPHATTDTQLLLDFNGISDSHFISTNNGMMQGRAARPRLVDNAYLNDVTPKFGYQKVTLDGSGDYIEAYPEWDVANPWTLEFFFKTGSTGTQNLFGMTQSNASTESNSIFIRTNSGKVQVYTSTVGGGTWNGAVGVSTSSSYSTTDWNHYALQWDGTDLKQFLNGGEESTTSHGTAVFDNEYYQNWFGGAFGSSAWFSGDLDEIRIHKSAVYSGSYTVPTTAHTNDSNTILLLHCEGALVDDDDLRYPSNPNVVFGGEIDTAQYKYGISSWYHDSDYDGIKMSSEDAFAEIGRGEFTFEAWVRKDTDITGNMYVFNANNQFGLVYNDTNNRFEYAANNDAITRITGSTAISNNTWYHIAVSRDSSGNTRMFLDGNQEGSTYADDRNWADNSEYLIGVSRGGSESWRGHIDEFRVSRTARYTSNFTAPTEQFVNDKNTLLLLHFDGSDGDTGNAIRDDVGVYK
tara:strand:+ start:4378 stop:7827 length:3450 start_codon:yes stop_codon:yes gene_type:complete